MFNIRQANVGKPDVRPTSTRNKLQNVVWRPSAYEYVDRPYFRNMLLTYLENNQMPVFVWGIGGCGKTEFVTNFVQEIKQKYDDRVCMMQYHGNIRETINKGLHFYSDYCSYDEIEKKFGGISRQEIFERKLGWLNENGKYLLVIDDFENEEDKNMRKLENCGADIIFITRNVPDSQYKLNMTECMTDEEAKSLFKKIYTRNDIDESRMQDLCTLCVNHPMTIILLAKLLLLNKYELREIYSKFQIGQGHSFDERIGIKKDGELRKDKIKNFLQKIISLYGLSDVQKQILTDVSILYPTLISPNEFLEKHYEGIEKDIEFLDKINMLHIVQGKYRIHPLIAECILNSAKLKLSTCRNVLEFVYERLKCGEADGYELGVLSSNVVCYLSDFDMRYQDILLYGSKYFFGQAKYENAYYIYDYLSIRANNDELKAELEYKKALNSKYIGKYDDSIEICKHICNECMNKKDVHYQDIYRKTLICWANNLHMRAETSDDMNEKGKYYSKALELYKSCLVISKKLYNKKSRECAAVYDNMGLMYANIGEFEYAYTNAALGRKIYRVLSGNDTMSMAKCYTNLGEISFLEGKLEEALEAHEHAKRIKDKILSKDHDSKILTLINLGEISSLLKRWNVAEKYMEEARDMASVTLSREHIYNKMINRNLIYINAHL